MLKRPETKRDKDRIYGVKYKGKYVMHMSPSLAIKQGLDKAGLKVLKNIHRRRLRIFDQLVSSTDPHTLAVLAQEVQEIEYQLQDAWGFDRDHRYHSWWFKAPKCTCPYMDNLDTAGTDLAYHSEDCPLHSQEAQKALGGLTGE